MGPQLKVSFDILEKSDIKLATPGLKGEEFIYYTTTVASQRLLCFGGFETILQKYD